MAESAGKPLKHLEFVHTYAHKFASGAAYVEGGYQKAKTYVPAVAQPYIAKAEETCLAYAAPLATKATDHVSEFIRGLCHRVALEADSSTPQHPLRFCPRC